jgi:uncharacterized damage-inducible protein DinB
VRSDPPETGDERTVLTAYLAFQRETVLLKTEGLSREQLAQPHPPSSMTLAGLLYHLAYVEESWSLEDFAGQPVPEPWAGVDWAADRDWEWHAAVDLEPEVLRERYREAGRRTDAVVAAAGSLDALSAQPLRNGNRFSLRWMLLHLVEETARHAGHADLLREAVDGAVGE